ncbi:OsmC family protein [Segetibacter koreensis]|uniref:OsmC family protein n=1 Tax=Segetibacter koreensis TaxID=398037 RepID=UPI00035E0628|nr:OsmC family protein [Segetibacter koreensis]
MSVKIIASALAENNGDIYKTELKINQHLLIADELQEVGGKDEGPAPGDYLCMALASCKAITLRMYAQRKNLKADVIKVKANLVKGADIESGNNTFFCEVEIQGDITDEQKKRMLEIAKACPIDRLLRKPSDIVSVLI